MQLLALEDAAVAVKNKKGKVKVIEELSKTGGHLFQTSLSQEDEDKLRQALEHDQIKASANEMVHDDVQV